MKIKVSCLEPNPFRKIDKYPFDKDKLKALEISIRETTFWDNILVRPHPTKKGKYQIGYGHHRLKTLNKLEIKDVDIPVRKLDDATMIQIMANENLDAWGMNPAVINETVITVKEFLDKELAKYNTYKELEKASFGNKQRFVDKYNFDKLKKHGVGADTIKKFLGDNWLDWMIDSALSTLKAHKEKKVDRKAVEVMPKLEHANKFKTAVQKHKIPVKSQKGLARQIVKDEIPSREIDNKVAEFAGVKKPKPTKTPKKIPWLDDKVSALVAYMVDVTRELNAVKKHLGNVQSERTLNAFKTEGITLQYLLNEIFP